MKTGEPQDADSRLAERRGIFLSGYAGAGSGNTSCLVGLLPQYKGSGWFRTPLPSSLGFQLFQDDQVSSANTSQPLPNTMDTHDLSWANWMCPLPLAPAKSSLLAWPQGSDLYPYTLQKTFLGLREDASNIKLQPPGLHKDSMDSEELTTKDSTNRDEMGNQLKRGSCLFLPPHTSSLDFRMNRKSPSSSTFWPWLLPTVISRELPIHTYPVFPGYPYLLPPPYLFTYAALPSVQCPNLFTMPPDHSYPTVAASSLLTTDNGTGPHITQEKPLLLYSGSFQSAGHNLYPKVRSQSSRDDSTFSLGQAGVAAPAKQPGSQAGIVTLPYPLKKKNGKILYECNECGKNFGQLSNLKLLESSLDIWKPLLGTS
ncbi:tissue-resident T-cell transcription regulator protein ZNF683-like [Phodopus roborovskii]|uniref:tissue-resident T-cell transcription regulator protein ZNF683-like n=1 Tax=Phodopus roborovskii TaxID=109678 RepID=UPI0021E4E050|nr:tissue-resident T-cell transcription regulator protein ZNF683-like [Phodopus roborovskii]